MCRAKPHRGPGSSPEHMEPIIAGRDLRKSWGPTLVLEHADFLLHAGDKVALVGPNGSGKSTLFRLLAGETTPDLGDLVLKPGLLGRRGRERAHGPLRIAARRPGRRPQPERGRQRSDPERPRRRRGAARP